MKHLKYNCSCSNDPQRRIACSIQEITCIKCLQDLLALRIYDLNLKEQFEKQYLKLTYQTDFDKLLEE